MSRVIYTIAILLMSAIFAMLLLLLPRTVTLSDYAMNTAISITVTSRGANKLAKEAIDEVKRLEKLMSATLSGSDVKRINNAEKGTYVKVSDEVFEVIEYSIKISKLTNGSFDITVDPLCSLWDVNSSNPRVPDESEIKEAKEKADYKSIALNKERKSVALLKDGMSINLGAVAKGYATDRIVKILKEKGVRQALIDLGGNIYVLGDEKTVGIQTPFKNRGEYFKKCKVSDKAVVTSGSYERYFEKDGKIYHHIIDPNTGYPAETGLKSVTIISKSALEADALSTAVFVGGRDVIYKFKNVSAIFYTEANEIVTVENT